MTLKIEALPRDSGIWSALVYDGNLVVDSLEAPTFPELVELAGRVYPGLEVRNLEETLPLEPEPEPVDWEVYFSVDRKLNRWEHIAIMVKAVDGKAAIRIAEEILAPITQGELWCNGVIRRG